MVYENPVDFNREATTFRLLIKVYNFFWILSFKKLKSSSFCVAGWRFLAIIGTEGSVTNTVRKIVVCKRVNCSREKSKVVNDDTMKVPKLNYSVNFFKKTQK